MLIPYGIGLITMFFSPPETQANLTCALVFPILSLLGFGGVLTILSFGVLFCLVIGIPFIVPAAMLGGLSVWLFRKNKRLLTMLLVAVFVLPLMTSPVEARFAKPLEVVTTHTSIHIDAEVEAVWTQIASVEPIQADEHRFNWLHYAGLPRPVAATLSSYEVGGVRNASFESGLHFDEEIVEWVEYETIGFTIEETSEVLLPPPLHLIDGETFDVTYGWYEIEPLEDGSVMLHLSSHHSLSTHFNWYGTLWTDYTMRNLQNYILDVIKLRAEGGAPAAG